MQFFGTKILVGVMLFSSQPKFLFQAEFLQKLRPVRGEENSSLSRDTRQGHRCYSKKIIVFKKPMPPCNVNMLLEFTDTYSILWGFQDLDSICNCQNLDTELFSWEFIARV